MAPVYQHAATFEPLVPFVWFGWVGVQIFFIVSGFVIASSASGASPGSFFQNRFLRLMPAAWVCATITLVALIASGVPFNMDLAERYLRSLSLWFSGTWVDGVYWTLAIEIMFYALVFGLLVWRKFHRLNMLAWGLACISWIFLLFRYLDRPLSDLPAMKWLVDVAEILPMKHGVYFALGIWLWMWANNRLSRVSAAGALVSVGFGFFEIGARAMEVQVEASAASGQPIIVPMLIWAAALAVIVIDARRPQTFAPSSKAARSIIILLGKTTYPLYLVHSVTGAALMHLLVAKGVAPYPALLVSISTMVVLAMAIAAFLEPRLRSVTGRALRKIGTLFSGGLTLMPKPPPAAPPGL
jgi:peptidoglycan/LPS O-acetylase OafA/YrhL